MGMLGCHSCPTPDQTRPDQQDAEVHRPKQATRCMYLPTNSMRESPSSKGPKSNKPLKAFTPEAPLAANRASHRPVSRPSPSKPAPSLRVQAPRILHWPSVLVCLGPSASHEVKRADPLCPFRIIIASAFHWSLTTVRVSHTTCMRAMADSRYKM